jgi:hypothetical protein
LSDLSTEAHRLLQTLCNAPSLVERLRGDDPRRNALTRLAALGELRVVPQLLRFFAADDPLSEEAWVAEFNRYQVLPGPAHLSRIRDLLDTHGTQLRADTANLLRFSLKAAGE